MRTLQKPPQEKYPHRIEWRKIGSLAECAIVFSSILKRIESCEWHEYRKNLTSSEGCGIISHMVANSLERTGIWIPLPSSTNSSTAS